jgi:hypothetical protein
VEVADLAKKAQAGDGRAAMKLSTHYSRTGEDSLAHYWRGRAAEDGDCAAIWAVVKVEVAGQGRSATEYYVDIAKKFRCPQYRAELKLFNNTFNPPKKRAR